MGSAQKMCCPLVLSVHFVGNAIIAFAMVVFYTSTYVAHKYGVRNYSTGTQECDLKCRGALDIVFVCNIRSTEENRNVCGIFVLGPVSVVRTS